MRGVEIIAGLVFAAIVLGGVRLILILADDRDDE